MKGSKLYGWFSWLLGLGLGLGLGIIVGSLKFSEFWDANVSNVWYCDSYFIFDSVAWYLILLTFFIWIIVFLCGSNLSPFILVLLNVSMFYGFLCYISNNAVLFWLSYEISIISLLILVLVGSGYSERYIAFWVFLFYICFSSLFFLLCILYLGVEHVSFCFSDWQLGSLVSGLSKKTVVNLILCFVFLSKIPLFPFHSWLPIVHSESSTLVSVCLSGYIMKLGYLGLVRFKLSDFSDWYLLLCLFFSIAFFFYSLIEMDIKRWLAFMSLAHASVGLVLLSLGNLGNSYFCFYYALGHGVSASMTFILFGLCQSSSSSRNWLYLQRWSWGSKYLFILVVFALLIIGSIPPILQFFSEVEVIKLLSGHSWLILCIMLMIVFFGNVCPLFVLGFLFCSSSRDWCIEFNNSDGILVLIMVSLFCIFILLFIYLLV